MLSLIDTHAHLDMLEAYAEFYISEAAQNNVDKIIIPAIDADGYPNIVELAERFKPVYFQLGLFPSEAADWDDDYPKLIKDLAKHPKCVGIGEIGLDYYWDKSFIDLQKKVFIEQIKIANELNLPITVHDREAHEDCLAILDKYNKSSQVVFHCFSGDVDFMHQVVERGYYIAIGGIVTFKKATTLHEVARAVPLDNLMLETDCPYLAPVPFRGKENQPAYVKFVAEEIARIKEVSLQDIATVTTRNAEKVFNL